MAAPLAMELPQRSRASIEAIVPAHQSLYGPLDSSIGHYRRYSLTGLREELERAGFDVLKSTYLNMLGQPAGS